MVNTVREGTDHALIFEKNRVKTFKNWPHKSGKISKENMAKAGWFKCLPESADDAVECFCCLKQMEGWSSNDDPWKEHLDHSPDCEFAKTGVEERKLTLLQFIKIVEKRSTNLIEKKFEEEQQKEIDHLKSLDVYQFLG